jgi:EamA domain-containing membrane protein RarD
MNGWHWLILTARLATWCAHAALSCAILLMTVAASGGTDKPKAIFWGIVFLLAVMPMIPSMIRWRRTRSLHRALTIDLKVLAASFACLCALGSLGAVIFALVGDHPWPDYSLGYWLLGIALLWVASVLFELATPARPRAEAQGQRS